MNPNHCDIPDIQNAPEQLERLAAQRQLYSKAKRVFATGAIASFAAAIVWLPLATVFPTLRAWAALYGIAIAILDIAILEPWQKRSQKAAADIQECFDCDVLQIPQNRFKGCDVLDLETVAEMAACHRHRDKEFLKLRDWYPRSVGSLPLPLARLVCQRTNVRWDARLRLVYSGWILGVIALICVASIAFGILAHLTVEQWAVRIAAPLLPVIVWGAREWRRQRETAKDADRIRALVESMWGRLLAREVDEAESVRESRALQDEIYDRRRRGPLVFDFVYGRLQPKYEDQAQLAADALIREARLRLGSVELSVPVGP